MLLEHRMALTGKAFEYKPCPFGWVIPTFWNNHPLWVDPAHVPNHWSQIILFWLICGTSKTTKYSN